MSNDELIKELLEILHVIRSDGYWSDEEATVDALIAAGVDQETIDRM